MKQVGLHSDQAASGNWFCACPLALPFGIMPPLCRLLLTSSMSVAV